MLHFFGCRRTVKCNNIVKHYDQKDHCSVGKVVLLSVVLQEWFMFVKDNLLSFCIYLY